jgi:D-threo-aldose 1-dehydrogenase
VTDATETPPLRQTALCRGLTVSELGIGTAEIGNLFRAVDDNEAQATLAAAAAGGVTLYDTAPFYGHGLSELRLGQFLRTQTDGRAVLVTKIGRYMVPPRRDAPAGVFAAPLRFEPVFDYSYDGTMRALEQSRMRLGLPRPDIVLVHDLDRRNHGAEFERHFAIAQSGAFRALEELRRSGDIAAMGISANEGDTGCLLLEAGDFDCALLAGRYTLLDQSAGRDFLPAAQARNIPIMLAGAFNTGILAAGSGSGAKYDYAQTSEAIRTRVRAFEHLCAPCGVPLAALALQFARAHPAIGSVVVGTSRPSSLARTLAAWHWPVPSALWEDVGRLLPPGAPLPR